MHLIDELERFDAPWLDATFVGRFCYVHHAGEPLCRLGYKGILSNWDFAIYRYSRHQYGPNDFFMPSHGTIRDCVSVAMHAYNLL